MTDLCIRLRDWGQLYPDPSAPAEQNAAAGAKEDEWLSHFADLEELMLGCYLTWHLRRAWAPLTFTDENPPAGTDPVAPARRSAAARAKASRQHDQAGRRYRSFRGLLTHLATLTRNQVRFAGAPATVPMLAEPTSELREAFQLIGAPIPLTLT
jgi:hypothetical protein